MDIKTHMIIFKDEDITDKVDEISKEDYDGEISIFYKGNPKRYTPKSENITILTNPRRIDLNGKCAYIEGMPVYDVQEIYDFGKWIRIIQRPGESGKVESKAVESQSFKLIDGGVDNPDAQQILDYFKEISEYMKDKPGEAAYLEMSERGFIHPESVLSQYMKQEIYQRGDLEPDEIIFPFRFNLSQKAALENALKSSISVIEGPPGTGKTQTILNILANLIIREQKSVAVVSNNNEAFKNVAEKLESKNYGFLTAMLGKNCNQQKFFDNMPIADVEEWDYEEEQEGLSAQIKELNKKLEQLFYVDRKRVKKLQQLRAWQLEQEHFEEYFSRQNVTGIDEFPLLKASQDKIIDFLAETSYAQEHDQTNKLTYKIRLLFKYRIWDQRKLKGEEERILLSLQRKFYEKQVEMIKKDINKLDEQLNGADFQKLQDEHQRCSEKLFRNHLYKTHHGLPQPDFTMKSFKPRFKEFIKTYPIILSTTYSLRKSIPENYLLDYVIIDESSMVDLITAALTFSCCRNVIIVGDTKQLAQITDPGIERKLKTAVYNPAYNYFTHNILSSVSALYKEKMPSVILKEHYRCHPQIIEFCNQKYYDGELIPYTEEQLSDMPLVLYLTAEGNHMRRVTRGEEKGRYNQREIDVILKEILVNPALESDSEHIGVITPYRKQANKAARHLKNGTESDTVHKYQGREKDTIIFSTVLDSTRDGMWGLKFVDDPQLINVSVSRAIKQFILVTDHELFYKHGRELGDLIRYMQYSTLEKNVIESDVISVFDLLYKKYSDKLLHIKKKMDKSAKIPSEEAVKVLLEEILMKSEYDRYSYAREVLLRNLLGNTALLTAEEKRYVNNRASLDFVVFYKQDKSCALVIEVDGFAYHENNPEQLHRDKLKDSILNKYGIPLLRLASNGSGEQKQIQDMLNKVES